MKRLKIVRNRLCYLIAMVGILISCNTEDYPEANPSTTGKEANVRVTLLMAAAAPKTYAISAIDENQVETIDVLAFTADDTSPSGWVFAYKAEGKSIANVEGDNLTKLKKQFSVTLIKNPEEQTFVILANVRNEIAGLGMIGEGTDKDQLLFRLVSSNGGSWNANNDGSKEDTDPTRFNPFPMWGEAKQTLADGVSTIGNVSMLRGIARMDVVLSDNVIAADNFKLDKIYIYNSKNKGYIVPAAGNLATASRVNAATVPVVAAYAAWNNDSPLIYTVPDAMRTAFERTIYLYEADGRPENESSKATCVVVGGKFGTDNVATYYRLDFLKKAETDSYFRDILRNHKYRVNIISVTGRGYNTPEDAFNSKAINIVAEVTEWDDGGMGDVVFDGQYALSVSPTKFEFSSDALNLEVAKNKLTILTDYPTGWTIPAASIVDATTGQPVTWVKIKSGNPGSIVAEGVVDVKANLWLDVEQNTSGLARSAKIIVSAGRLRYPVLVNQGIVPAIGLDIFKVVNSVEIPTTELLFTSAADVQPAAQFMKVSWTPIAASLMVTNNTVGSAALFPASSGAPVGGILAGGTGTVSYTIRPPALTAAELSANPLLEKVAKVDFIVSNGAVFESKSVFLRQLSYAIVVQPNANYLMDGTQKSFKVRANAAWRAEIVENPNNVISNITLSGGPNGNPGSDFSFTMINDLTDPSIYLATAKVRFSSPEGKFADKLVDINCVSGELVGLSNSYIVKPNGRGILIPVSRANQGVANSIAADAIFTVDLLWTDNSAGVAPSGTISNIIPAGQGSGGHVLVFPGSSEGNAVVTVKVNNVIKWSWHIWVTNYEPEASTTKMFAATIQSMDRNLGALGEGVSTTQNGAAMTGFWQTGLFYQWGRKDPFVGSSNWVDATLKTLYTKTGATYVRPANIAGTIPTPDLPGTWVHSNRGVSWGDGGAKTIYDPCPIGWRVPSRSAWDGATTTNMKWITTPHPHFQSSNMGRFPAAGFMIHAAGAGVNVYAWTWSSTPSDIYAQLLGGDVGVVWKGNYLVIKENGLQIRCVKE